MGGTIGFFVGGGIVFILSINFPELGKIFMNPIVFMIIVVFSGIIGSKIEENGKITTSDVKEAVKGGVGITFGWFAIWIAIGLAVVAVVYFFKILNYMPTNY